MPVHRVTMFKVPNPSDAKPILEKYSTIQAEAKKDGKPYILRCIAGQTVDDARNQGYGLCAEMTFASMEDMKYYDEECEAHASLKAVGKGKVAPPPLIMVMEDVVGKDA